MEGAEKAAGGDQFVLEDLLDFSNEEEEEEGGGWGFNAGLAGNSTDDSSTVTAVESCGNSFSSCGSHVTGDLPPRSFAENVLCGLQDDQAELEWLSNFVEESFSSEDLHIRNFLSASNSTASTLSAAATAGVSATNHISRFQPEAAVPAKARSKRSRPAPCSWTSQLVLFSPSMTADSSPESEFISAPVDALQNEYSKKLPKKTHVTATMTIPTAGRRCLHCQAEKTPQWRAGPMGPKTLCNACGVRYKSGRLVPEYRPAASPTFVPSKHSNSHRKVIELRRQKDLQREGGDIAESYASGSASEPGGDGFFYHHGHAGAELKVQGHHITAPGERN